MSEHSLGGHYLERCSCGAIIAQCRCPGPKMETIVPNGCVACRSKPRPKGFMTIEEFQYALQQRDEQLRVALAKIAELEARIADLVRHQTQSNSSGP